MGAKKMITGDNLSEPLYLRALEVSDMERCYKWHNDRTLYETLVGYFHFVTKGTEQAWLDGKRAFSEREINLAICLKGSDKHIGNIYLREIDWISRRAQLEIFIGDSEERSKSYGQSAIRQLLSYAFSGLGLKRIYLDVLADNKQAIHVYEKCGFSGEGRLKNHVFKQGGWKDVIVMGICFDEFTANGDGE
jgi:RimJ/RimL family protein N-acetyltransferase